MRSYSFHVGAFYPGLILVLVGVWFLMREMFDLGPWFAPATLGALALLSGLAWLSTRAIFWITAFFFSLSWAAYKALDFWFGGTLPYSFLPAFWGIGFLLLYSVGTRPLRWPLIPAALLLGTATVMYVIGVGVETARYWIPGALVLWGVYMIARGFRGNPGRDLE